MTTTYPKNGPVWVETQSGGCFPVRLTAKTCTLTMRASDGAPCAVPPSDVELLHLRAHRNGAPMAARQAADGTLETVALDTLNPAEIGALRLLSEVSESLWNAA